MDFRARRQLAVLAIVVLVAGGIGYLIYTRVSPPPTCQDNKTNQGEEDTDCGGPCISCAFKKQQPISIFWTRYVKVRENTYDVVAEIQNPNIKLASTSFVYEFQLYDTAGVLVASRKGTSYLYPGETTHLVEIGLTSGRIIKKDDDGVKLVIKDTKWGLADRLGPDVIAGNREYAIEEDESGARKSVVRAIIQNRTLEDIPNVEISTIIFDSASNVVGANRTILDSIAAGATTPVRFVWPSIVSESISSVAVEVRSRFNIPKSTP
jgi:hypothetical protein